MPVHKMVQPKLAKMHALGSRAIQAPAPQLILGKIKRGHRPNGDVVHRHGNRSCDLIATANPRHSDRQQGLERIQRRETKENSDRRPESNRMRRVSDRHQRHVVRDKPALQPRQRSWQSRLVNRLAYFVWLVHSPKIRQNEFKSASCCAAVGVYPHGTAFRLSPWPREYVFSATALYSGQPGAVAPGNYGPRRPQR